MISQGVEMGRPSTLHARADGGDGLIDAVEVGGARSSSRAASSASRATLPNLPQEVVDLVVGRHLRRSASAR